MVLFVVGLVVGLALGVLVAALWLRGRVMQLVGERDTVAKAAVAEITEAAARAAAAHVEQVTHASEERAGADLDERRDALQGAVADLVRPISEELERYRSEVDALGKSNAKLHGELKGQIEQLVLTSAGLKKETASLVTALRRPEVRGTWGEQQLRRIVELAGMLEHCDFDEQVRMEGASGGAQRPDLVVHLPNTRQVIVDAKVPLDAFLEGAESDDPPTREGCMKRHARQLREHVEALAKRRYQLGYEGSVDFVVAFVPSDALLAAAYEEDRNIVDRAVGDHVLIATPITLIALLRAVSYGWQQDAAARDAHELVAAARTLYDRLATMTDHLVDHQKKLRATVDSYNRFVGSLEQRVLPQARRLEALGASTEQGHLASPEAVTETPRQPAASELQGGGSGSV